jgi:hypothetical protein
MDKTGLWSDDGNWSLLHVPTSQEDAVFTSVKPGSIDNCLYTGGSGPAGLFIFSNYPNTITFNAAMEIGNDGLDMEGGNIAQPVAGADITVDGLFHWVAGMLNTSAQRNNVFVNGSGIIEGTANRTTGSLLQITGLAQFRSTGDLSFVNNAGMNIQSAGTWSWTGTGNLDVDGTGIITNNGTFSAVIDGGGAVGCALPIDNNGSSSTLRLARGTLNVTGVFNGASVFQSVRTTILDQRTTLGVSSGMMVIGGNLYTNGNLAATINGDLSVSGAHIRLNALSNAPAIGQLVLTGSGNLTIGFAGEFDAEVDAGNGICGGISASGNVTLGAGSILEVTTFNIPQGGVPANMTLALLSAARGSTMFGDFDYKSLAFNDGSGGSWQTEVWNRGAPGRGFTYLLKS